MTKSKSVLHDELVNDVLALPVEKAREVLEFCQAMTEPDQTSELVADAQAVERMANEMQYNVLAAHNILDHLCHGLSSGMLDEQMSQALSITELSARAFKDIVERDCEDLISKAQKVCSSIKETDNANQ